MGRKLRVQVLGFSIQSMVSVDYVLQTFQSLPAWHRWGIRLIRYDPLRNVAQAINEYLEPTVAPSVQGSFYHSETLSAIIIWKFRSVAEFRHILFHEVGHHVFARVIAQAARDRWFYEVRPKEGRTVSAYACKNAREDFSECYASWFTQPELLEQCPLRKAFLQEEIFHR
jgi:hypothetical protein